MRWFCACGSADIFAVKPGADPEYGAPVDLLGQRDPRLGQGILISRGVEDQVWCRACWAKAHYTTEAMNDG